MSLGKIYRETACLWRGDPDPEGFGWIDCEDREQSVYSYQRWSEGEHVLVVLNMTPIERKGYRIGAPTAHGYRVLLSSNATQFGGSGAGSDMESLVQPEQTASHGMERSVVLDLPPLGALVLEPKAP
jgi:1,4-alpha-glucan branching enzyme